MDLQLEASALVHRRKLTWREKRQTKKFLESSAAMLRDRVEADQAFLFGPMPPQVSPLVLFTKQFACDEEHSPLHLSKLVEPGPRRPPPRVGTWTPSPSSRPTSARACAT